MKYSPMIARSLIALLFIVAGYGKLTNFSGAVSTLTNLGIPLPTLVALIVIFIEIVVALAFAYGYRVCVTGWTLIAFTGLTIIVAHRDITNGMNMIMALKNLAIMGGIWAAIQLCECGKCPVSKAKHGHSA